MKPIKIKSLKAFNLQELLVVLVIIGVLLLLVLPNLMPLISKSKSLEAQTHLNHIYTQQKTYFYVHNRYSDSFYDIDFEVPKTVKLGGKANYEYEILESTSDTFKARAVAVTDFDSDGVFNVWEINENQDLVEITKD